MIGRLLLLLVALCLPGVPASAQTEPSAHLSVEELRQRYADPESRFATISGVEIHYKDEGEGPVLLMVHGSASSLRTWDGVVAQLKDRYRIIRYDVAGMGLSGQISDEAAAALQPTDIAEGLLKQLGVSKVAAAVGVSSGGTLVSFLASKRPDMIERLILSNMPSDPVVTSHLVQPKAFLDAQARAKRTGIQDIEFWNEFLSYFAGDPARITQAKRLEYYDFNRRQPSPNVIALVAQIKDGKESTIRFAQVTTPALLLWGGADKLLPVPAALRLESYLPKAPISRVVMPDVGHYPPLEVPERYALMVASYIEGATPLASDR